jgi:hypothetical protein
MSFRDIASAALKKQAPKRESPLQASDEERRLRAMRAMKVRGNTASSVVASD